MCKWLLRRKYIGFFQEEGGGPTVLYEVYKTFVMKDLDKIPCFILSNLII